MAKKLTIDDFIKRAKKIHGDLYDYSLVEYINMLTKIIIKCRKHNKLFEQQPNHHLSGFHCCNICGTTNKLDNDEFIKRAKKVHGNIYDYSLIDYKNTNTKVKIICKEHGIFKQLPNNHLTGQGCNNKECYSKKRKKTCYDKYGTDFQSQKSFSKQSLIKLNDKNWLYNEHIVNEKPIYIIAEDLRVNQTTVSKYFKKHEIEIKLFSTTQAVREIIDFLSNETLSINDRSIISPYELDVYLPDKKIAIEYCGLYWHSEAHGKDSTYHLNKLKLCQEKGIKLLTIFEDEWFNKQQIIKNKLKYFLKNENKKIFARNCSICVLLKTEKTDFFDSYHIQGDGPGSISYSLLYNNEIVAAITFIKKKNSFILNRYATSCNVVGGFSKLLKHFQKNNNWEEIITFADMRWSDGYLYEKCGFILDKILPPDYSYIVNSKKRMHKFNFRHNKLKNKLKNYDHNISEKENCIKHGIFRIWDCGKKRYVLTGDNHV